MPDAALDQPASATTAVLWIDDDDDYQAFVTETLESVSDLSVLQVSDLESGIEHLDDVDCVVSALELPATTGHEIRSTVRERRPDLPFVLHTKTALADLDESYLAAENVEYVRKNWDESSIGLLAKRVRALVELGQLRNTAERLTVAVDACHDPILVVEDDDTIEYANGQLASAVSPARTDLCGRPWTALFTDDSVRQLQHEAVPVGTEGWTWSGTTVLTAGCDEEVTARTTLVQLDDGSKVFAFRDLDQPT